MCVVTKLSIFGMLSVALFVFSSLLVTLCFSSGVRTGSEPGRKQILHFIAGSFSTYFVPSLSSPVDHAASRAKLSFSKVHVHPPRVFCFSDKVCMKEPFGLLNFRYLL